MSLTGHDNEPLPAGCPHDPRPDLLEKLRELVAGGLAYVAGKFNCSTSEAAARIGRQAGISGAQMASWCRNCPLGCDLLNWCAAIERAANDDPERRS